VATGPGLRPAAQGPGTPRSRELSPHRETLPVERCDVTGRRWSEVADVPTSEACESGDGDVGRLQRCRQQVEHVAS
jgi:hypothetical protein